MLTDEQLDALKPGDTLWRCAPRPGVRRPTVHTCTVRHVTRVKGKVEAVVVNYDGDNNWYIYVKHDARRWAISEAHALLESIDGYIIST